jgi:hypothetical protein
MSSQTVTINGVKVKVASVKKHVTSENNVLYPKDNRDLMSPEKLNELFERAISKSLPTIYTAMDLKLDDPDKLAETYDLEMIIARTRTHHVKYDMHDVFTVVKPNPDIAKYETINLYENYATLTKEEVAASNEWYSTMTEDPQNKYFRQNLNLTHEHLVNNCHDDLVSKVTETYYSYPDEQHGGPLFFKIMMDAIQNNSEESAEYLVSMVKNMKLTSIDGENVEKAVSLVRGAVKRLENLKIYGGKSALPLDMAEHLLKVFQTSSVPVFNQLFEHYHREQKLSMLSTGIQKTTSIAQILTFAEQQYRTLCSTNDWLGIKTKAKETAFIAGKSSDPICFNCGGAHNIKECPKQRDVERIKINKKKFWESMKSSKSKSKSGNSAKPATNKTASPKSTEKSTPSGKWAPPTKEEKQNQSRRIIDDIEYYYHYKSQRWRRTNTPAPPLSTNVALPAPPSSTANPTLATTTDSAQRELVVANLSRQIAENIRGFF